MPQKLKELFNQIKSKQNTVDILLKEGILGSAHTPSFSPSFPPDMIGLLTVLYQEEDCSIGFVDYTKRVEKEKEQEHVPLHQHFDSIQYLIVVKGSLLLKLIDKKEIIRVMKIGDCASIPVGLDHKTIPLEEDTKLFFICIPQDSKFHAYLGRD